MNNIDTNPPVSEVYYNAIATPVVIKHPPDGKISGCLYSSDGKIIHLSQRFGGGNNDLYPCDDSEKIEPGSLENVLKINGRCIYLGHYMTHYGHFLVEMLSTFWCYDDFNFYDYFVFHPFVFGEGLPIYIKEAFHVFGISSERLIFIQSNTLIEQITIPERLVKLNKSANIHIRPVYSYLVKYFLNVSNNQEHLLHGFYYLSRVRISRANGHRVVINEPLIEKNLRAMGFMIIYPELLSFSEQIVLINNAKVVCGLSGSALHNCVFMNENSVLIEIADARPEGVIHPMQQICNDISYAKSYFLSFKGLILHRKNMMSLLYNRKIINQIEEILLNNGLNLKKEKTHNHEIVKRSDWIYNSLFMVLKNCLRLIKWYFRL